MINTKTLYCKICNSIINNDDKTILFDLDGGLAHKNCWYNRYINKSPIINNTNTNKSKDSDAFDYFLSMLK